MLDSVMDWAAANPKHAELAMATTIVVVANFLAQAIVKMKKSGQSWLSWDFLAILRMASWCIISTPIVSIWLQTLTRTFGEGADALTVGVKLVVDQFLFGPAMLSGFFLYSGIFDSVTKLTDCITPAFGKIRNDLLPAQRAGWAVWIPTAILNFSVVPDHLKILWINFVGLFWNIGFALMLSEMEDSEEGDARKTKAKLS
eukprot:CAMPEP_0196740896 /NCGR_PEP_ID=MMETSP1091-20130531/36207_1 /TAXON_ID=302021 /ORGANISM="Rhodomonas sp., Strain CCMP768" /LENGTH=199 /DNA_ID=CAMNT_0042086307 /DNA_START=63 /DNA_END=662 /DNA_ORIENTATION=-